MGGRPLQMFRESSSQTLCNSCSWFKFSTISILVFEFQRRHTSRYCSQACPSFNERPIIPMQDAMSSGSRSTRSINLNIFTPISFRIPAHSWHKTNSTWSKPNSILNFNPSTLIEFYSYPSPINTLMTSHCYSSNDILNQLKWTQTNYYRFESNSN